MEQVMRCKNCGAELDARNAVEGVIECEYCFSKFTVSKDETPAAAKQYLHDGESELYIGDFDKAYSYYQKAAELADKEPEAYFGMALAKAKVRYLNDKVNDRLQPIVAKIGAEKFADDPNCLRACLYATAAQRELYEKQANEIDYIREEFFKLENAGLDYDCFICVKVTDDVTGGRTADYKSADDIYYALKHKGYKPFFSEIELTGMTGADYEARILYALYKSECMMIVCSNEEYLQTKWVKNEYTRFLRLVNDQEKESDSIAIVYSGRPIEYLPGKNGKLQGINLRSINAIEHIVNFVDNHTPEAKKRREAAAMEKNQENEALKQKLAALEAMVLNQNKTPAHTSAPVVDREQIERERKEREEAERIKSIFAIENGVLLNYKGKDPVAVIPDGVKEIYPKAFGGRPWLTSVTIPEGVKKIGMDAFIDCRGLTEIFIPSSVTDISAGVFDSCSGLQTMTVDKGNKKYHSSGNCIIETESKTLVAGCCKSVIPTDGSVTKIGKKAFSNCKGLKNFSIPNRVVEIGESAFQGCEAPSELTIPDTVASIGSSAFCYCTGIKVLTFPNSAVKIGSKAFSYCLGLETVKFGKGKPDFADYIFSGCENIKTVYTRGTNTFPIGLYDVPKDNVTTIVYEGGNMFSASITGRVFPFPKLEKIVIKSGSQVYIGSINYIQTLKSVYIESGVTIHEECIMENCNPDLTVYCVDAAQPSNWNKNWNKRGSGLFAGKYNVVWGYTGNI